MKYYGNFEFAHIQKNDRRNLKSNRNSDAVAMLALTTGLLMVPLSILATPARAQIGRGGVRMAPIISSLRTAPTTSPGIPTPRPSISAPGFGRLGIPSPFSAPGMSISSSAVASSFSSSASSTSSASSASSASSRVHMGTPLPSISHTVPPIAIAPSTISPMTMPGTGRVLPRIPSTTIDGTAINPALSGSASRLRFNNTAEANAFRFGVPQHNRYYYAIPSPILTHAHASFGPGCGQ